LLISAGNNDHNNDNDDNDDNGDMMIITKPVDSDDGFI
jgi:hypothetical protein